MRKIKNSELNRIDIDTFKRKGKTPIVVVLDNVRSLNNIGSVFRTSDAFLVEKICLCGISATPPNPEIHKTALGSTDSVDWEYHEETSQAIEKLKREGFQVIGIEQVTGAITLHEFKPTPGTRYAIVFGNEVKGIQNKCIPLLDKAIEVPQFGTKHSLNISVCAGIVIWDLFQKMKL